VQDALAARRRRAAFQEGALPHSISSAGEHHRRFDLYLVEHRRVDLRPPANTAVVSISSASAEHRHRFDLWPR
jgi:hypothetical protein